MTVSTDMRVCDEELKLLTRARHGESEAFDALAQVYETRLYQQAIWLCGNLHDAEDLTVETLIEAWRSLNRFDGSCRFSTWLYGILVHRHQKLKRYNRLRSRSLASFAPDEIAARENILDRIPDPQPQAFDQVARNEELSKLQRAVMSLAGRYQAVVWLRFFEDASLPEIAAALEIPLGTVKSRLHHALEKLRSLAVPLNLFEERRDT